jgi:hypothetical protein
MLNYPWKLILILICKLIVTDKADIGATKKESIFIGHKLYNKYILWLVSVNTLNLWGRS